MKVKVKWRDDVKWGFEPVFQIYFCTHENYWVWIYYPVMLNLCSQASLVKWDVIRFNQTMAVYTASRSFSLSVHIMINRNLCWIFVPLVTIKYGFCRGKNLLSLLSGSTNSFLNSLRFAISPFTFITATLALNFVEETPQRSFFPLYFALTLPRRLLENLVALIIFF